MVVQQKLIVALMAAAACAFVPGGAAADPIIPNGNFSAGYSGFTSGYSFLSSLTIPNYTLMYPEGTFTVGSNPRLVHDRWASFGDHTTGNGGMMIVNGNRAGEVIAWSTTVAVAPNTHYDFSAWAASTYSRSPGRLAFSVNGTLLDAPINLSSTTGAWQQFSARWYSGSDTSAVLSLIDRNTEWNGNDFALDDIALTAVPMPEPTSLLLFGTGFVGLRAWRKRRQ